MVKSVINVVRTIGGAIAGSAGSSVFGTAFRVASAIYTAIDSLTNRQESPVSKAASPTYTFGKLQTQVSNLIPRPIVYGKVKVAGNKIWQTGENTSTIRQIVCLCDGEINSISDVRLNDIAIDELPGCSYTAYTGNGTQGIDSRVPGDTQADKAAKVGGLKYDAYLAITAQASKQLSSSGFNTTCIIEGRFIRVYSNINNYSVQYNNNPAWCLLDFLTCYNGMGLSYNEIDLQSFIDAALYCDETVDGQPRFALNLVLDAKQSRLDWLNAMLLVCRGYLLYHEGKIYLKIDCSGSSVQSFNGSNIVAGSEKFWTTPRENKYDVVKVQFIDPDNEYARVYAVAELPVYGNEQPLVKTVEAFGITNFKQASRLAWFYLNEASTAWKFMTFTTTKEGLDRTIGDIIDITSEVMGFSGKLFRIVSMYEAQEGQIEVNCKEYNGNLYNDTLGSVAPSVDVIDGTNVFATAVTDITLHGNVDSDQTRVLQQLVDNLSAGTGGTLNVDSASEGVYLNAALNVKSNVHVNFKCPVFLGEYGQLRIYGGFDETPTENLPQIRVDLTAGTNVIYCGTGSESLASNYSVGDRIIIRGLSDGNGQAIELQEATVASVDTGNNNIYIEEELEYSYKASYPAGNYEEVFGVVDRTYITFVTHTALSSSANRGNTSINVASGADFSVGDYVFIGDNKTPSDIAGESTNTYRHEVNKIVAMGGTGGSVISLENALCHDYETAYSAYITKVNMVENASIEHAKVNYSEEPAYFTVNAFTIAYAKDCYIRNSSVKNNGNYTSKGHGFRIDRSIVCTIDDCSVYAPKHVDAAEGYGFTIYRANHNTIVNCRAYGCRHSFLLFRGACNNRINNVFSVNARVSDIDFHGGEECFNVIDGFTVVGGDQKYGNNLSAIKFGNEYHVAGCYNNIVRNGNVINYKGYGIDIVPVSENNLVENVSFKNIERLLRCVDLSVDGTLKNVANTVKGCVIDTVDEDLGNIDSTLNGGNSQIADNLTIENCVFRNIETYFKTFKNTVNCKFINNTLLEGVENAVDPWFINAENSDNLLIQGNVIQKGSDFIKIKDCSGFICRDNRLIDLYNGVILDDVSGNDGYIFKNNDCEGFEGTLEYSEGGSGNGINIKNNHIARELVVSELVTTAGLNITGIIPFDGSTPLITEGCEVLNCIYKPSGDNAMIKIECIVPAVYTDTATNAVLTLFKDTSCIGATGIRLPNTGSSSGSFIQLTTVTEISSLNPFSLSLRLGSKTTGPTLTVGDRFNELGLPYLVITETGFSPSTNNLYQEDLAGLILTEDYEHLNKE